MTRRFCRLPNITMWPDYSYRVARCPRARVFGVREAVIRAQQTTSSFFVERRSRCGFVRSWVHQVIGNLIYGGNPRRATHPFHKRLWQTVLDPTPGAVPLGRKRALEHQRDGNVQMWIRTSGPAGGLESLRHQAACIPFQTVCTGAQPGHALPGPLERLRVFSVSQTCHTIHPISRIVALLEPEPEPQRPADTCTSGSQQQALSSRPALATALRKLHDPQHLTSHIPWGRKA